MCNTLRRDEIYAVKVSGPRAPIRIGKCSIPTGHWFSQAPHVVHCQSTYPL